MKETYSWLIYSCLIFGTGTMCDKKLEKRQAELSGLKTTENTFCCSNGLCILWSSVCDGQRDCSDGSDENEELCGQYEYEINKTSECGRIHITDQPVSSIDGKKTLIGTAPWNVGIYVLNEESTNYELICGGSIIAPNLVVSAAHCFWYEEMSSNIITIYNETYKVAIGKYDSNFTVVDNDFTQIINVETIYLNEDYTGVHGFYTHDIAVIVLSKIITFNNFVAPICIDWNGSYNVPNGAEGKIVGWGNTENDTLGPILLESSLPYIDRISCENMFTEGYQYYLTNDKFCAGSALDSRVERGVQNIGAGLAFVHSKLYYLTGILSMKNPNTNDSVKIFIDIQHNVKWILKLYNKYLNNAIQVCVLPTVEGVLYTYENSNEKLDDWELVLRYRTVIENCDVGYHKIYSKSYRVCLRHGKWFSTSEKLCISKGATSIHRS